jgi:outer membrane protein
VTLPPEFRLALAAAGLLALSAAARAETVTVEECGRRALERSPSIRAARFEMEAARARSRAARGEYAPRLDLHSEYGRSEGFDETVTNGGSTAAIARLEATLLDGGARDAGVASAQAASRAAAAVEKQRRSDLLLEVRSAYFRAVAAGHERDVHRSTTATLDNYRRLLSDQSKLGIAVENDVMRAKLAVDGENAALRATDAELSSARAALSSLSGVGFAVDLAEPSAKSASTAGDDAIAASPLLAEARAELEASQHEVEGIRSEGMGRVTVSAEAGALGVRPRDTFEHDGGGQFLLGFTVPLFDGGTRSARLAAALAAAETARAKLDEVTRMLRLSWAQAGTDARRAEADAAAARESGILADRNFQLMRARHAGGGNVRLLEVLDALAQTTEARLAESRAVLAYRIAVATQSELLGEVSP